MLDARGGVTIAVDPTRRRALRQAAAGSWGEEVADTLVELVAPSGHELATREDIAGVLAALDAMDERWDARFAAMDDKWETRLAAMDENWEARFTAMDARLAAMDESWQTRLDGFRYELTATFERGISAAVTSQTRTLVFSQLGALVVLAGIVLGLR